MPDEEVMKEYIKLKKEEKRQKSIDRIGGVLKAFGHAIPKGVRNPDSMVRNTHLYIPGRKGKTIL